MINHFSKIALVGGLALGLASCGRSPERPKLLGKRSYTTVSSISNSENATTDVDRSALQIISPSGSKMRLLDARGLTVYYARVFPKKDFGFMHCSGDKPLEADDCTTSIFSAQERVPMGSFDLNSPGTGRGNQNVRAAVDMTLNYTRTLRAGLSRECESLVTTELTNLTAKIVDKNLLIKTDTPTADDIDRFYKKMFGVEGTTVKTGLDSASYLAAFTAITAANKDKNAGTKDAYLSLCVALAMDPMVFLY